MAFSRPSISRSILTVLYISIFFTNGVLLYPNSTDTDDCWLEELVDVDPSTLFDNVPDPYSLDVPRSGTSPTAIDPPGLTLSFVRKELVPPYHIRKGGSIFYLHSASRLPLNNRLARPAVSSIRTLPLLI